MSAASNGLSRGRRAAFTALMLVLPVLFFAVLEGGLRLAGYGDAYPLFVPVPGHSDLLTQNREVARRYFARQASVPTGIGDVFPVRKDSSEYRIFVQGGSSAAGYPYYYGGSFSRMLQQRLQQTFPDRTIRVVNTALAAVNSYTLLDFADEIARREPDAVLIYAGHNEFYGALGVGSAETLGRSPRLVRAYLGIQHFRTVQLVRDQLARMALLYSGRSEGELPGATLMQRMVREQRIPIDSPLFRAGLAQWNSNLRALIRTYVGRDIPVYVATVAANERDHPPFESSPTDDSFRAALNRAANLAVRGDSSAAFAVLDSLGTLDPLHAAVHFRRARLLDDPESWEEARSEYLQAKDLDQLRFRAPEEVNEIVRRAAAEEGAIVVEVRKAFADASRGRIIDSALILEHLHPNADGYFLMADAFYDALRDDGRIGAWDSAVPEETAREERLLTVVDSLFGTYRLRQLMGTWPFAPPGSVDRSLDTLRARTAPEALALQLFRRQISWYEATDRLRAWHMERGDWHRALKTSLAMIQQFPFLPAPYAMAGDALVRQQRADEALAYYGAAVEREDSAPLRVVIGDVHSAVGRHAEAAEAYRRAVDLAPRNADAALKLGRALVITGDTLRAIRVLENLLERVPAERRAARALSILSGTP